MACNGAGAAFSLKVVPVLILGVLVTMSACPTAMLSFILARAFGTVVFLAGVALFILEDIPLGIHYISNARSGGRGKLVLHGREVKLCTSSRLSLTVGAITTTLWVATTTAFAIATTTSTASSRTTTATCTSTSLS
jgi:hypothetical protein